MTNKQPEAMSALDIAAFFEGFAKSSHKTWNGQHMHIAAAACLRTQHATITAQAARIAELERDAAQWRNLYRQAINEANGLTNYCDDRPELRRAEVKLGVIQAEAWAIDRAMQQGERNGI